MFTYNIVITGYKEIYEAVKNRFESCVKRFERIGNHTAKTGWRLKVGGRQIGFAHLQVDTKIQIRG